MIKKTALITTLLFTFAHAEIQEKGFFVGIDISKANTSIEYDNTPLAFALRSYTMNSNNNLISYKFGYQYHFTRLYARVNSFEYKDAKRDKYLIKGTNYELNAEYIPVFFMSKSKEWNIRGVFGLGVGYSSSKLENYDINLLPVGVTAGGSQQYMEYGAQIGLMSETSIGVSVELGARYRKGTLLEFTDGQNDALFSRDEKEYYLGVNYLF